VLNAGVGIPHRAPLETTLCLLAMPGKYNWANLLSPARLRGVDSLVEEVVEEQVLELGVVTVAGQSQSIMACTVPPLYLRLGDVLEEYGSDNAATTPHERNLGLVQLPLVFLGGLSFVNCVQTNELQGCLRFGSA
jgi:hypothetical protein